MSRSNDLDLRRADTPDRLFARLEAIAVGLGLMGPPAMDLTGEPAATEGDLHEDGYALVADIFGRAACEALATMIDRLLDAGLPAVFVLATDAALELGQRVERTVSSFMRRPYVVVDDAWAWRISPGSSGWPPHRGVTTLLDRDAPELVNTWVALSDVESDRSCMHFVRLDDDPAYPRELGRIDAVAKARAAPVQTGSLLFWNANSLHWGGRCSPEAAGPRFSCSFSLERADVPHRPASAISRRLTPVERIDLVAGQIAVYGEGQPDVSPEVLDWARAASALRRLQSGRP